MASPEVLDFDRLLAPIPGDDPAGPNLRRDYAPDSIYRQLKEARSRARAAERQMSIDEGESPDTSSDWRLMLEKGQDLLATHAKDFEITAWLIEALLREHGFAGLRDGLRLARELAEQYWDTMHPLPDEEDGYLSRVAALRGLNGEDNDGTLIAPIRQVPLTVNGEAGPLSHVDYLSARELDQIEDPDRRHRRIEEGAVTIGQFEQAMAATAPEQIVATLTDIDACLDELVRLDETLSARCEPTPSGEPVAPSVANIRNALRECRETLQQFAPETAGADIGAEHAGAGDGQAGGEASVGINAAGVSAQIQSREEAFNTLLRIAEFFKKTEPHSPISYALEQIVRWGRMPLPHLWTELLPDDSSRDQLFKMVGLPREQEESD